jgi:putative addiction module component (TIGR02574 family)
LLLQPACPDSLPFVVRPLAKIQEEIRTLSASEKEALLRLLWEELDGPSDPDVEAAWLEEVRRRGQEIDAGQVELVPPDQVFRKLGAALKK